jgi:hypothetical protein
MEKQGLSRRTVLSSAIGGALGAAALFDAGAMAAQTAGVKRDDLLDLTIKEVKVYVTDLSDVHRLNSTETGELISVVTHSGIEGNYTLGDRNRTEGWLDWAKSALVGRSVIDLLPTLVGTSGMKASGGFDATPRRRPGAPNFTPPPDGPGLGPAFGGASVAGSGLQTTAAADRGRISTPQPPMCACGTSSERLSIDRFTKSFKAAPSPRID